MEGLPFLQRFFSLSNFFFLYFYDLYISLNLYLCVNFVDGPIGDQQSQQAFSNGSTVDNLMQNFTLFQNHFKVSRYCSSWVLGNSNLRTEMKYRRKGKSVVSNMFTRLFVLFTQVCKCKLYRLRLV